ncbi:MAG: KamA family radical SAM protein, partial [Myxococcota bacterium]
MRVLPIATEPGWKRQAAAALRRGAELERVLTLSDAEREGIAAAEAGGFPIAITPYYLSLIDPNDPDCPIRRQVVPTAAEAERVPGDLADPLGEEAHEVAPGLVRRYPDRVLLLATDRCAVYCRFCTRSRMVGDGGGPRSMARLEEAFAYIEADESVQDVIVSGGDPMVMATRRITSILRRLASIPHVLTVRLASRAPVTLPQRVDPELCAALREAHPSLWVMTHFNHPKELTEASTRALSLLVDHGLPVMNQSVLLRGVNDSADTLEALFRGLVRRRVRPYYLLQADVVGGTAHLRTPLARGLA